MFFNPCAVGAFQGDQMKTLTFLGATFVASTAVADITTLDAVAVTATRQAERVDQTLANVSVITREQIEKMQARDLAEVISHVAGVEVVRSGGAGQITSIFTRGTESDHTLVLVDGVKINPGTLGSANLSVIHPDIIEKIEVVKGPRSALYGSEAIGGVIHIFTRQSGPAFSGAVTVGTDSLQEVSVNGYTTLEQGTQVSWGAVKTETGGFPTYRDADHDSGHDNLSFHLGARHTFNETDVNLSVQSRRGNTEYSAQDYSNFPDIALKPVDQDFTQHLISVSAENEVSERWVTRVQAGYFFDELIQNQSPDFVETERFQLDWENDFELDAHLLTAGVSLQEENIQSLSFGSGFDESITTKAIFLQDSIAFGAHSLLFAGRYTDHENFGTKATWEASYGYTFNEHLNVFASAATAFRAPSAPDLYGYGGNPDLKAEDARNIELGIKYRISSDQAVTATAFHNDIDNLVEFVEVEPFVYQGRNVARARTQGVELTHEATWGAVSWQTSVALQSAKNRDTGARLLRRAQRSLTSRIYHDLGRLGYGFEFIAQSDKRDFGADIAGYGIVNATLRYQLAPAWVVEGKVLNLFDNDYEQVAGYNTQGFGGLVSIVYRPN